MTTHGGMVPGSPERPTGGVGAPWAATVVTVVELAALLRQLRRREARRRGGAVLTYRELAARTGWSRTVIGSYLAGDTLPPTDRFDALVRLLGASAVEQGQLATARDRVEDRRRAEAVPVPDEAARAATAAHDGPVTGGQVVPRQLPAAARAFAGRHAELRTLTTLAGSAAGRADGAVVAVIDGAAGIGNTALAVHAANREATQFPDGQLYVDLRGFAPAGAGPVRGLTPGEAVRGFLDALAVPVARLPATASALTGLYRSLLADRRLLVLLDNAADADQVRPLLPGTPGCLVVVTSRNRLTGLVVADGAEAVRLGPLTAGEGHALLIGRLGPERVAAERPAVDDIVRRCAGLPLALSIVAARAATAPRFPLAVLAGDLQDARQGLDALDAGEPSADLRSVLSWSVRELDAPAARLFRLLGLHSGADIGVAAAASLAGLPQRPVRRALAELCQVNLLAEHAPGRYSSHDLVRAYARELAHAQDPAPDRLAAVRRLLDHYLLTAVRAATTLDPHRAPIVPAAAAVGITAEQPADYAAALAWLTAEHLALLGAV
ncbi:MAG TPA: helix-turn-helix domain-containing protein, partial [Pilimelia sp.]|nr:helix-turn-helix domain-containing protein [Pilimelia sp.]